jgi:hypothetical protein
VLVVVVGGFVALEALHVPIPSWFAAMGASLAAAMPAMLAAKPETR